MSLWIATYNARYRGQSPSRRVFSTSAQAETADWLDKTVPVAKISDLSLDEWVGMFRELRSVVRRSGSGSV